MEICIGGISSSLAGVLTNPLEVIKIRIQLQGELKGKGLYNVHYKNIFQSAFTIAKNEGFFALQKGLLPCIFYQFIGNGIRLGAYQYADENGLMNNSNGERSSAKIMLVAASTGIFGNVIASPFYLVKTHLQSKSNVSISVGHQHNHQNMFEAFSEIYRKSGLVGLWRGSSSQIPRLAIGSATQLLTFEKTRDFVQNNTKLAKNTWGNSLLSSFISGLFVTTAMAPNDLIATRFYNQGIDPRTGKGILYKNIFDCAKKVFQQEGLIAFLKGWLPAYLRLGPYTLSSLLIWDRLKLYHSQFKENNKNVFHAGYTIALKDGLLAVQKGLVPALYFQFVMNGVRLGFYQWSDDQGWTRKKDGSISTIGSIIVASVAGALGCTISSPFYLVKTHLQSRANELKIAVGYQHEHTRMFPALQEIYRKYGFRGLWRGNSSSLPRIVIASSVQLPTFALFTEIIKSNKIFPEGSWLTPFASAFCSGLFVSFFMAPPDLVSTRYYNQPVDLKGKGIYYDSVFDCARKIYITEKIKGFYKGWSALYFRIGPHTVLCLLFWDKLKFYHKRYSNKNDL